MNDRYIIGRKGVNHRKRRRAGVVLFVFFALIGAAGWWIYTHNLKPNTTFVQAKPRTIKISFDDSKTKHFDETDFGIDLPTDWVEKSHDLNPYNVYTFQGTTPDSVVKQIQIYEDKIPQALPLNRAIAVEANGPKITLRSQASDTCDTYTKNPYTTENGAVPAKWEGFDFLCDLTSAERNATGTVSAEGKNQLTITGTTGQHRYFLVYTDHNFSPDEKLFYSTLETLQVK